MIEVKASVLRKGDTFRFGALSSKVYTMIGRRGDTDSGFMTFDLAEMSSAVTVPLEAVLYAETMYRLVTVPCIVGRHDVTTLYNAASGGTLRGVVCGECDARVTARVMKAAAEDD